MPALPFQCNLGLLSQYHSCLVLHGFWLGEPLWRPFGKAGYKSSKQANCPSFNEILFYPLGNGKQPELSGFIKNTHAIPKTTGSISERIFCRQASTSRTIVRWGWPSLVLGFAIQRKHNMNNGPMVHHTNYSGWRLNICEGLSLL